MRNKIVDWLSIFLMIEGVIALTLLILFTIYRMLTGN
jgi:hypothetical protein